MCVSVCAQMDWMLPGLPPTGNKVSIPVVAVVEFEGEKVLAERIMWDQASVLVQLVRSFFKG